jgi:formamidopyrimidine-DNA glycosylase
MPELPEVEYTRRNLDRWMRGRRIVSVQTNDARIVRPKEPKAFIDSLTGRTIRSIDRRGKWLRLNLDDGTYVFSHLGMTGWYERSAPKAEPRRFERVGFDLERVGKRSRVSYVDSRRWGRLVLSNEDITTWSELGPDPLGDGIDVRSFAEKLRTRRRSIKEVLLDQTVVAGVGNIMAIEALWKAKIDPRSRADALGDEDIRAIASGLRWTIGRTLENLLKREDKGPDPGGADNPFRIYGRKGDPCPRCGRPLERVSLGGRTTTFCPGCQVRRRARQRTAGRGRPRGASRPSKP